MNTVYKKITELLFEAKGKYNKAKRKADYPRGATRRSKRAGKKRAAMRNRPGGRGNPNWAEYEEYDPTEKWRGPEQHQTQQNIDRIMGDRPELSIDRHAKAQKWREDPNTPEGEKYIKDKQEADEQGIPFEIFRQKDLHQHDPVASKKRMERRNRRGRGT